MRQRRKQNVTATIWICKWILARLSLFRFVFRCGVRTFLFFSFFMRRRFRCIYLKEKYVKLNTQKRSATTSRVEGLNWRKTNSTFVSTITLKGLSQHRYSYFFFYLLFHGTGPVSPLLSMDVTGVKLSVIGGANGKFVLFRIKGYRAIPRRSVNFF